MNKQKIKDIICKRLDNENIIYPEKLAKELNVSAEKIRDCCWELGLDQIDDDEYYEKIY